MKSAIAQLERLRADYLRASDGRRLKKLLSLSGIRAWKSCPKRYELWELKRIAEFAPSSSSKQLGRVVHELAGTDAADAETMLDTAVAANKISKDRKTQVTKIADNLRGDLERILQPRYYSDIEFEPGISAIDPDSGWLMLAKPDAVITRFDPRTGSHNLELVEMKSSKYGRELAEEQSHFSGLVLANRLNLERLPLWILLAGRIPIQTAYSQHKGSLLLAEFRKIAGQIEKSFQTGNFEMKPGRRCNNCPFRNICPGSPVAKAS